MIVRSLYTSAMVTLQRIYCKNILKEQMKNMSDPKINMLFVGLFCMEKYFNLGLVDIVAMDACI